VDSVRDVKAETARDETAAVLAFAGRGQNGPAGAITVARQLHLSQLRTRGLMVGERCGFSNFLFFSQEKYPDVQLHI